MAIKVRYNVKHAYYIIITGIERHREYLQRLCRVCGDRYSKRKNRAHQTSQHHEALQTCFGISADNDNPDVHPGTFCHKCYLTLKRSQDAVKKNSTYKSNTIVLEWLPHCISTSQVCQCHNIQQSGGRPSKKGKHPGRPKASNTHVELPFQRAIHLSMTVAPATMLPPNSDPLPENYIHNTLAPGDFTCLKCKCILNQPLVLKCQHIICLDCCIYHFKESMTPTCSICQTWLESDDIKCPQPVILHALESILVICPGRCRRPIKYGDIKKHDCSKDKSCSSQVTLEDVCNTRVDKTPTEIEWRALGHLAKRLMKSSSIYGDENSILVPTGGQVSYCM